MASKAPDPPPLYSGHVKKLRTCQDSSPSIVVPRDPFWECREHVGARTLQEMTQITTKQASQSLAGQMALIVRNGKVMTPVTFGSDVWLTWVGGDLLRYLPTHTRQEISGNLKLQKGDDFSLVKNAELILNDNRVFTVTFYSPSYFS